MYKTLEQHEHAEHLAHAEPEMETGGRPSEHQPTHGHNRMAALLVAVLAAALAVTEQGAKHAEIRVEQNAIYAADAWGQYQAKSTRATLSHDLSDLVAVMDVASPEVAAERKRLLARLNDDQQRFEKDPNDGKAAIFSRAKAFEEARDHSLETDACLSQCRSCHGARHRACDGIGDHRGTATDSSWLWVSAWLASYLPSSAWSRRQSAPSNRAAVLPCRASGRSAVDRHLQRPARGFGRGFARSPEPRIRFPCRATGRRGAPRHPRPRHNSSGWSAPSERPGRLYC